VKKPPKPPQPPDDEPENTNETPNDEYIAVQDFVAKFPECRTMSILKVNEQTGRYAHKAKVDPSVVSEDYLQRRFGPGTYEIRFHASDGRVLKRHLGIEIDPLPEDEQPAAVSIVAAAPASPVPDVLTMMREEANRNHQLMLEMIRAQNSGGNNLADVIGALGQLKQLEPKPEPDSMQKMTDVFLKGLEFRDRASGKQPSESTNEIVSFFRDVLDMAKPLLNPAKPSAADPAAPGAAEEEVNMDIEPALTFLKAKCKRGCSVELIREMILDQMEGNPEFTQVVMALIQAPAEEFLALDEEFKSEPYKSWMNQLHALLRLALIPANPGKEAQG
jgi:hypothetical protein